MEGSRDKVYSTLNMERYLERAVYEKLTAWKNQPSHGTLEVSGARQVGKTYIVRKFAGEQYDKVIYINMFELSGELFLGEYQKLQQSMENGSRYENPIHELMKRYDAGFINKDSTVVIIDEIQESADIYNRVREFTRSLNADFIITGSYLGRILNKEFKYSAGDIDLIEVNTLDFEEFIQALGKKELWDQLDLSGNSSEEVYQELERLFAIYGQVGGYPSVVLKYLESQSVEKCHGEMIRIIRLFSNESKRYFEDILDGALLKPFFLSA